MFGEKHDIIHEFPEYKERIHELKINNAHFAVVYSEYHEVDNQVRRIEEGIENTSDEFLEGLKQKRLALKDEIYAIIQS